MRFALLSDVHGNLPACEAVLADARARGVDGVLCLGDMVGYGPCPGEVLALLREAEATMIMGNHDAAVVNLMDYSDFRQEARDVVDWTRKQLSPVDLATLVNLPYVIEEEGFTCVHSEMVAPEAFYYLDEEEEARACLAVCEARVVFIGHTHTPMVHRLSPEEEYAAFAPHGFGLLKGHRYVINVGSVGFPRDGDYRASYVIYDTEEEAVTWLRVAYDVRALSVLSDERLGHHREVYMLLKAQGELGERDRVLVKEPRDEAPPRPLVSPRRATQKRGLPVAALVAILLTVALVLGILVHVMVRKAKPDPLKNLGLPPGVEADPNARWKSPPVKIIGPRAQTRSASGTESGVLRPGTKAVPAATPRPTPVSVQPRSRSTGRSPGSPIQVPSHVTSQGAGARSGDTPGRYSFEEVFPAVLNQPGQNTFSLSTTRAHGGARSLAVKKAVNQTALLAFELETLVPVGSRAEASFYVHTKSPSSVGLVCTLQEDSDGFRTNTVLKRLRLSPGRWHRVEVPLSRSPQTAKDSFRLALRMDAPAAELFLDDLEIVVR